MAYKEKPTDFHSQALVWSKDAPAGGIKRGWTINVLPMQVEHSVYESKQKFLKKQDEGDPKLKDKTWQSHNWIVRLMGVSASVASSKLIPSLTRAATPDDKEFDAPDEPDRIVLLSERKWFFDFTQKQLDDLEKDGEINLTKDDAELIIKRTDGVEESFVFV